MGKSLAYKILEQNLLEGELIPGREIKIRVNQTLTQDSTGTMVYLQLQAMDVEDIKTDLSVAYIDHNMLQMGFENADDHEFIKSCAEKYGLIFSKPGGGICHQVHLENFGKPGTVLLGSDSHTPTGGGLGQIAIGAGGLDVATAMAQGHYYMTVPKVLNIKLTGALGKNLNGKDVILSILKKLTVKGGVGYVIEYTGDGAKHLSVTERATICNMGAELGATTSIFESDENSLSYLKSMGRGEDYVPLTADEDAHYDKVLNIDLSEIRPQVAYPHSPDSVKDIAEKIKVDQVAIGSCTNSSYKDLMTVANILDGKKVHPDVSLVISPGSSNILLEITKNGALEKLLKAGARILESGCGPCIGMGQAPKSKGVSLRTFNRNFKGRSGTMDAQVYLVSPETAAFSAITGYLTDPSDLNTKKIVSPEKFETSKNYFIYPVTKENRRKDVVMGPNIKPFPINGKLPDAFDKKVVLKVSDNITTDDICPSNARLLPYRSNIPYLSNYSFTTIIDDFAKRCEENTGGFIVAGENYGQGSSREHAALVPLYLGIKAVIAKSFARIHKQNLINSGILPLVFKNTSDYECIEEFDRLKIENLRDLIKNREGRVLNMIKNMEFDVVLDIQKRDEDILIEGGYLNFVRSENK